MIAQVACPKVVSYFELLRLKILHALHLMVLIMSGKGQLL